MSAAISEQADGDGSVADDCIIFPEIEGIEFVNYVNEEQLDDVMRLVGQDLSEPYSIFTYRYFLHRWPQLCILAVPTDDVGVDGETKDGPKKHRRPIGCVVCKIDIDDGSAADEEIARAEEAAEAAATTGTSGDTADNSNSDSDTKSAINDTEANAQPDTNQSTTTNDEMQSNNNIVDAPNDNQVFTGYIGMLAVENTHRRSGIGTALVQRAIHRMKEMGCESIKLETEVSNKAAMRLYEDRLGFIREELLTKYYLNWGDAYRLRLWL